MDDELWDLMTDRDKLNAYECACQDLAKANARLAEAERERDTLRQRWESEAALDALDGVLEAAVEGIEEYAAMWQGRRQEYIDTIKRDIRTVQAAQRAARSDDQPTEQAERGQAEVQ